MTAHWNVNQLETGEEGKNRKGQRSFSTDTYHHYGAQQVETLRVDPIPIHKK